MRRWIPAAMLGLALAAWGSPVQAQLPGKRFFLEGLGGAVVPPSISETSPRQVPPSAPPWDTR